MSHISERKKDSKKKNTKVMLISSVSVKCWMSGEISQLKIDNLGNLCDEWMDLRQEFVRPCSHLIKLWLWTHEAFKHFVPKTNKKKSTSFLWGHIEAAKTVQLYKYMHLTFSFVLTLYFLYILHKSNILNDLIWQSTAL